MNNKSFLPNAKPWFARQWPGFVAWGAGGLLMLLLDGRLALDSLAMLLVLTAAAASVWLRLVWSVGTCLLAVMIFNWLFVSPRGNFAIDLQQDVMLLLVTCAVSMLVAAIMAALRAHSWQVQRQALIIGKLRDFGDALRDASQVLDCLPLLQQLLCEAAGKAAVLALKEGLPSDDDETRVVVMGAADALQMTGLWHCLRSGHTLGPGTGRYQTLQDIYLPLRGRSMNYGAVLLHVGEAVNPEMVAEAQALCDLMGAALEREHGHKLQQRSDQRAHEQSLRATLLTAIAHDYRTPLATIMGAASSLQEQDDRLTPRQRQQLARRIVAESARLGQLTSNILQLARLDTPSVQLQCDWQSAEELAGGAVQRCPQSQRVQMALENALPLLWCDPLLVSQLLDNLLDNACKFGTRGTPVRLEVQRAGSNIVFAVSDTGPGIPAALQQVIFHPFRQGHALAAGVDAARRGGFGLGLALCRSIAAVHGGELRLQVLAQGSRFEFLLPLKAQPSTQTGQTFSDEASR